MSGYIASSNNGFSRNERIAADKATAYGYMLKRVTLQQNTTYLQRLKCDKVTAEEYIAACATSLIWRYWQKMAHIAKLKLLAT